ncbi:MAG TPA: hypothetical protein VIG78_06160, partial [Gemmatimonadaceae bacterium]
ETIGWGDYVDAGRFTWRRILEGASVVELSAEIEAAQEAEDLTQWCTLVAPHPLRDRKLGTPVE